MTNFDGSPLKSPQIPLEIVGDLEPGRLVASTRVNESRRVFEVFAIKGGGGIVSAERAIVVDTIVQNVGNHSLVLACNRNSGETGFVPLITPDAIDMAVHVDAEEPDVEYYFPNDAQEAVELLLEFSDATVSEEGLTYMAQCLHEATATNDDLPGQYL